MSRRVDYRITVDVSINESDLALLECLGMAGAACGSPLRLPAKWFARELNLSLATVRRSFKTLHEKGLIVMRGGTREDGGRDANVYEITALGLKVLNSQGFMRPRRLSEER